MPAQRVIAHLLAHSFVFFFRLQWLRKPLMQCTNMEIARLFTYASVFCLRGNKAGGDDIKIRVQSILRRNEFQFVLFIYLILGCSLGVVEGFLFLWLEELGVSKVLMGFSLTSTCISEVPIFFVAGKEVVFVKEPKRQESKRGCFAHGSLSGNIMERLGFFPCLYLIFLCYAFRLFFYATLTGIPHWYLLPVQLLHGITYGLCWATGTAYISTLSEADIRSSLQVKVTSKRLLW